MKTIKERFLEIVEEKRVRKTDLATELDVPQSSVSSTLNKGDEISKMVYYKALQALTSCNLNWVINGIGEKYLQFVPDAIGRESSVAHNTAFEKYADGVFSEVRESSPEYEPSLKNTLERIESNYSRVIEENAEFKKQNEEIKKMLASMAEQMKKL